MNVDLIVTTTKMSQRAIVNLKAVILTSEIQVYARHDINVARFFKESKNTARITKRTYSTTNDVANYSKNRGLEWRSKELSYLE